MTRSNRVSEEVECAVLEAVIELVLAELRPTTDAIMAQTQEHGALPVRSKSTVKYALDQLTADGGLVERWGMPWPVDVTASPKLKSGPGS